jgi:hypothetical protein
MLVKKLWFGCNPKSCRSPITASPCVCNMLPRCSLNRARSMFSSPGTTTTVDDGVQRHQTHKVWKLSNKAQVLHQHRVLNNKNNLHVWHVNKSHIKPEPTTRLNLKSIQNLQKASETKILTSVTNRELSHDHWTFDSFRKCK